MSKIMGRRVSRRELRGHFASGATTKMRTAAAVVILVLLSVSVGGVWPAAAQAIPKSLQQPQSDSTIRATKNAWTVGIVGGLPSGTYMRFAIELAQALDDGDNLRILPIVSFGAASNLDDLLYLRGVDIAVTQSDVFEYFRTVRKTPSLNRRVNYVIRLPVSEVHILARDEIHSIEDLRGKKVNLGPEGSASSLTGAIIFQRLGINIEQTNFNNPVAMQKLKSGELSALVRVVGKPVDALVRIPQNSGFHILSIPFSQKFADYYTLGEFSSEDYPTLIPSGQRIDTIAVPAVLAVYNWSPKTDRFERVKRFIERLFENWDKFQHPPFHAKWRDVNLAATVPGWTRFSVAEQLLQRMPNANASPQQKLKEDFQTFLSENGNPAKQNDDAARDALFKEFMAWRQKQGLSSR
jgi:TRAP-type uncharacterized transport system substrate-binding protein